MNNNSRAAYPYIALAFVSLAGGVACVIWADELGGYRFIGVSVAVIVAMLSLAKMRALRRGQAVAAALLPKQPAKNAAPAPRTAAQSRDDAEDAEIEARLAALRRQTQEPASALAMAPVADDLSSMVVIEAEPLPEVSEDEEPVTMQEMEELRAQIARLSGASGAAHGGPAEGAGTPNAPASPSRSGPDPFARTEFSGLGEGAPARPSFEKTEYLQPIAMRR